MSEEMDKEVRLEEAARVAHQIRSEIGNAVIGQQEVVEEVLIAFFAAGHVLVEGAPGLGKTLLVQAMARTFQGESRRIQSTPDLMPSDVVGHVFYEAQSGSFRMRPGPVFTNLLLADEINRAPAKTQSALLEVMQERHVTLEGRTMDLPAPFMTLATQNPFEQEGTYPLPEAQLDRFLFKILIDYPQAQEEEQLVKAVTTGKVGDVLDVDSVSPVLNVEGVLALQKYAASVQVDDRDLSYAVEITRRTREWPGVALGAGPRGGLALVRASRALALLSERGFITPDDVRTVALPALRHRIQLSPDVEIEGQTTDNVLSAILRDVDAPRV